MIKIFVILCLITTNGFTQELWDWSEDKPYHNSVVKVQCDKGSGTGVIIYVDKLQPKSNGYIGYCLTAWHVVQDDLTGSAINIQYNSKIQKGVGCFVKYYDKDNDVAILQVWVPKEIKAVKIAKSIVRSGDRLEYVGYGGGVELGDPRHWYSVASVSTTENKTYADTSLLGGDSGSPVFNKQNEIVGVISGGWFWMKHIDGHKGITWPARTSNVKPIRKLFNKLKIEK